MEGDDERMIADRIILVSAANCIPISVTRDYDPLSVRLWPSDGINLDELTPFIEGAAGVLISIESNHNSRMPICVRWRDWVWSPGQSVSAWAAILTLMRPELLIHLHGDEPIDVSNYAISKVLASLMHEAKYFVTPNQSELRCAFYRSLLSPVDDELFAPLGKCNDLSFRIWWQRNEHIRAAGVLLESMLSGTSVNASPLDVTLMWPRLSRGYEAWFDRHPGLSVAETKVRLAVPLQAWTMRH